MPRSSDVYSKPAGTTAVANTTIESSKYNQVIDDLVTDANTPRPIVAGGTGASTASAARTALGVQAADATLTNLATLGTAADKYVYTTGVDTFVEGDITAAGRALLDDADASAQRTTLGLGTAAVADLIDDDTFASATASNLASAESIAAYVTARLAEVTTISPAQTISGTANTVLTWAHGLGSTPDPGKFGAYLQCKVATNGWAVGDRIPVGDMAEDNRLWTVWSDATNVGAVNGINPGLLGRGAANFTISSTNFDLYFWVRT